MQEENLAIIFNDSSNLEVVHQMLTQTVKSDRLQSIRELFAGMAERISASFVKPVGRWLSTSNSLALGIRPKDRQPRTPKL
jgi:hypothetical protein